jgi:hypothetical protein
LQHSIEYQQPIILISDMDYPRAFVSFPRIAGSGNEIGLSPRPHTKALGTRLFDVILFYFSPAFAHFIIFFLSRFVQSWIEISFSNLRVRIKCFVVKRMRICNTTMAVHGFQNSKKPVFWRRCTSICATISLGGKWILTK